MKAFPDAIAFDDACSRRRPNVCGERFRDFDAYHPAAERFFDQLASYRPRAYVEEHLSLADSARRYLSFYDRLWPAA